MADLSDDQLQQLCAALGWQGGTFWQVLDEVKRLRGERAVFMGLLTDCTAVLNTIVPSNCDEAEKMGDLISAIYNARDPHRRKGALL